MISTRDELLTAVRRAEVTPLGLTVGPLVWVKGQAIRFGRVTDEPTRRVLLNKLKLAASKYFLPTITWEIPKCLDKTPSPLSKTKVKTVAKRSK